MRKALKTLIMVFLNTHNTVNGEPVTQAKRGEREEFLAKNYCLLNTVDGLWIFLVKQRNEKYGRYMVGKTNSKL